jgi:hypothetical protein
MPSPLAPPAPPSERPKSLSIVVLTILPSAVHLHPVLVLVLVFAFILAIALQSIVFLEVRQWLHLGLEANTLKSLLDVLYILSTKSSDRLYRNQDLPPP